MCKFKTGWEALGFKSYQEYLYSDIWIEKRKKYLEKKPNCEDCGKKAQCVHHNTYENCGNEKKRDLSSLCIICHKKRHNKNG